MPRYRLVLEYDGRPFWGWQNQKTGPSVQGTIEAAAQAFCGEVTPVYGAGRTDTGVHALAQNAHLDFQKDWPEDVVRDALNHHLRPLPVAVIKALRVEEDFHARFDAGKRFYLYRIMNRRAPLVLQKGRLWHIAQTLDDKLMHTAAQIFTGRHDFTTFRATQCQAKSPVKTLDAFSVKRYGEEIRLSCVARSFLHRQVRSMVGALVETGRRRWTPDQVRHALKACDRTACAPVAPAEGLYLAGVDYHADDSPVCNKNHKMPPNA